MLDEKPQEAEWLSWTWVVAATLAIFATVPIARTVQAVVSESVGRQFFLYFVAGVAGVGVLLTIRTLAARQVPRRAYFWLAILVTAFAAYTYSLRSNPEEAIHFVEYGILGVLVYRALVHRIRDTSVYATAIVVTGTVGIIDESLQWLAPSRYWDLRDLQINLFAGILSQLAIALGMRPRLISSVPTAGSLRTLCRAAAFGVFLLGLSFMNTPERIAVYASKIPALSFLLDGKSVMVEYGHLHVDESIGIFRSRFTLEQLEELDEVFGRELGKVLDEYIDDENYGRFLEIYSVVRNPYIHEAGVHLFRRNRYLEVARTQEVRRDVHYNIALRENQILEKYFPTGIAHSTHAWSEPVRNEVASRADRTTVYESRVSMGLITRLNEGTLLLLFAVTTVALLVASVRSRPESGDERKKNENL